MRLLLDHCVDRRLAGHLSRHEVRTAAEMQRDQFKNGRLLSAAADAGFDVVLTTDRNLKYQQNLQRLSVAVLVLVAPTNKVSDLVVLIRS